MVCIKIPPQESLRYHWVSKPPVLRPRAMSLIRKVCVRIGAVTKNPNQFLRWPFSGSQLPGPHPGHPSVQPAEFQSQLTHPSEELLSRHTGPEVPWVATAKPPRWRTTGGVFFFQWGKWFVWTGRSESEWRVGPKLGGWTCNNSTSGDVLGRLNTLSGRTSRWKWRYLPSRFHTETHPGCKRHHHDVAYLVWQGDPYKPLFDSVTGWCRHNSYYWPGILLDVSCPGGI